MITTREAALLHKVSEVRIRVLCAQGRIEGAEKKGRDWLIPQGAKIKASDRPRPGKIKMA